MRTTLTTTLALSTAVLALGALAAPAGAERVRVDDASTTGHGADIASVTVDFGRRDLTITSTHDNLRRDFTSGASGRIYLDTDREDWGPEYVLVAGFFEGTDYQMFEADGFARASWGRPVHGGYEMSLDYRREQVELRVDRATLGGADEVRVAMRASGARTDGTSHGLVDWLGDRRDTTPWVARG